MYLALEYVYKGVAFKSNQSNKSYSPKNKNPPPSPSSLAIKTQDFNIDPSG